MRNKMENRSQSQHFCMISLSFSYGATHTLAKWKSKESSLVIDKVRVDWENWPKDAPGPWNFREYLHTLATNEVCHSGCQRVIWAKIDGRNSQNYWLICFLEWLGPWEKMKPRKELNCRVKTCEPFKWINKIITLFITIGPLHTYNILLSIHSSCAYCILI